jgi:hypothetical protein
VDDLLELEYLKDAWIRSGESSAKIQKYLGRIDDRIDKIKRKRLQDKHKAYYTQELLHLDQRRERQRMAEEIKESTATKFNASPTLVKAVKIALTVEDPESLALVREIFDTVKEKYGDNYEQFKSSFGADIQQQLEEANIGRGMRGRGLSYKGKHHGYIRKISRMAKGL